MPSLSRPLLALVGAVALVVALACGSSGSSLADRECAAPPDANACEQCLAEACGQVCRDCVDDPECYACTIDDPAEACFDDEQVAALVACVVGQCRAECDEAPSRKPRDRVGRGRRGGGKGKGKGRRD